MLEVTESTISYHRPLTSRTGVGGMGIFLGILSLTLLVLMCPRLGLIADCSPAELIQQAALFMVPLAGLFGPAALFLYEAGPCDLVINTTQRTYRFRRGFPFLAFWQSGPLDDIAALRVKTSKNNAATSRILLNWKNTQVGAWTLGNGPVSCRRPVEIMVSQKSVEVRAEANRLALRLGVPVNDLEPEWDEKRRRALRYPVLVPAIFFCFLMGLSPLLVAQSLQTDGRATTGTVTELRHGKGLSVRYTYHAGPRVFDGSAGLPPSIYGTLRTGGPVLVRYLPAYPHTSKVVGSRDADDSPMMLAAAAFLVVLLLLT